MIYENYNANESNCCLNCLTHSGPVTQRKRIIYAHIFVDARSVRRMRNSSVDRTWTVIDCQWMCVEGGLYVILSFERFKKVCVIHKSACVVYASSMHDYARDTRRPSVLMRLNWIETAHVHVRPLTPHLHITHEQRTYHARKERKCMYVELSRSVLVWTRFVSDSWVGRASNVRGILHRTCSYASTCAICQWFVSDCK